MKKEELAYKMGYRITENGEVIGAAGFILKKMKSSRGYYRFNIKIPKTQKSVPVLYHRLQAFQKFGEIIYDSGIIVRHLNNIKEDNSFNNIAVGTIRDNFYDIPEQVRINRNIVSGFFHKKHDHKKIKEFYIKSNNSYALTMKEFNITSKGTLHYIVNKI